MTPEDFAKVLEGATLAAGERPEKAMSDAPSTPRREHAGHRVTGLCFECGQALAKALYSCVKESWLGEIRLSDYVDLKEAQKLCEEWPQCDACLAVRLDRWEDDAPAAPRRRSHCVACLDDSLAAFGSGYVEPVSLRGLSLTREPLAWQIGQGILSDYLDARDTWVSGWPYCDDCPPLIVETAPTPTKAKRADDISEAVLSVLRNTGERLTRSALIEMVGGLDKNNALKIMDGLLESGQVVMEKEGTSKFYKLADE